MSKKPANRRDPTMRYISRVDSNRKHGWIIRVRPFRAAFVSDLSVTGSDKQRRERALSKAKSARNQLLRQQVAKIMEQDSK